MCHRHFLFSYVRLTRQLHTTPSEEYMPLQSRSLSVKLCHTDYKLSPTGHSMPNHQRIVPQILTKLSVFGVPMVPITHTDF